jgi:hypothetical protein
MIASSTGTGLTGAESALAVEAGTPARAVSMKLCANDNYCGLGGCAVTLND